MNAFGGNQAKIFVLTDLSGDRQPEKNVPNVLAGDRKKNCFCSVLAGDQKFRVPNVLAGDRKKIISAVFWLATKNFVFPMF